VGQEVHVVPAFLQQRPDCGMFFERINFLETNLCTFHGINKLLDFFVYSQRKATVSSVAAAVLQVSNRSLDIRQRHPATILDRGSCAPRVFLGLTEGSLLNPLALSVYQADILVNPIHVVSGNIRAFRL
jgi:hypothetical protein